MGVSGRCKTCGELIEAENRDDFYAEYTKHQVEVHDRPATVFEAP